MMTSELVANVLRHTVDEPCLVVLATPQQVHVAITDHDPTVPAVAPRSPMRVGGNGLRIIDALSDRWGVQRHDGNGKTVWFDRRLIP